jgi:cbb3-type cytochrome oxidase subunit 3
MDINTIRILVTLGTFAAFVCIVMWAYGPSRSERFERDGHMALDDDGEDAKR